MPRSRGRALALRRRIGLLGPGWTDRDAGARLRPRRGRRGVGGRCRVRRNVAHQLGIVAMVRRHRAPDLVLVVAVGVGADVDAGDELEPVEIGEAGDAPRRLRLWLDVPGRDAARRVQHTADEAPALVGPIRTLGAVEADQSDWSAP
jgi:hypothetical protein